MKRMHLILIVNLFFVFGCLTAGTHGSLKAYAYPVSKTDLQNAVKKVISKSSDLTRDSSINYYIDVTNGKNDTVIDNHYNDGINYWTIEIGGSKDKNYEYVVQFTAGSNSDSLTTSALSIAYAYDANGNGGSKQNMNAWFLRGKLIARFEKYLIERVDSELRVKHSNEK